MYQGSDNLIHREIDGREGRDRRVSVYPLGNWGEFSWQVIIGRTMVHEPLLR